MRLHQLCFQQPQACPTQPTASFREEAIKSHTHVSNLRPAWRTSDVTSDEVLRLVQLLFACTSLLEQAAGQKLESQGLHNTAEIVTGCGHPAASAWIIDQAMPVVSSTGLPQRHRHLDPKTCWTAWLSPCPPHALWPLADNEHLHSWTDGLRPGSIQAGLQGIWASINSFSCYCASCASFFLLIVLLWVASHTVLLQLECVLERLRFLRATTKLLRRRRSLDMRTLACTGAKSLPESRQTRPPGASK